VYLGNRDHLNFKTCTGAIDTYIELYVTPNYDIPPFGVKAEYRTDPNTLLNKIFTTDSLL
jgi:hypothetical protein